MSETTRNQLHLLVDEFLTRVYETLFFAWQGRTVDHEAQTVTLTFEQAIRIDNMIRRLAPSEPQAPDIDIDGLMEAVTSLQNRLECGLATLDDAMADLEGIDFSDIPDYDEIENHAAEIATSAQLIVDEVSGVDTSVFENAAEVVGSAQANLRDVIDRARGEGAQTLNSMSDLLRRIKKGETNDSTTS